MLRRGSSRATNMPDQTLDTRAHPFPLSSGSSKRSQSSYASGRRNSVRPHTSRSEDRIVLGSGSHRMDHELSSPIHTISTIRSVHSYASLPRARPPSPPLERPPSYTVIRIPDSSTTYRFLQEEGQPSSMLLVPPTDVPDPRPLYRITVGHDPFLPTSFITSITKAPGDRQLPIGRFKTMLSNPTHLGQLVSVHGKECRLGEIFVKGKKKNRVQYFDWGNNKAALLRWSCPQWPSPGTFSCYDPNDKDRTFAEFTISRMGLQHPTESRGLPPQLAVKPIGHFLLDDILMSLLLLERHRQTAYLELESKLF